MKRKTLERTVKGVLSGMLVTMAVVLGGCGDDKAETASTGEITIGIPQDLEDGLDPHKVNAAGTKEILFNIYEGLVKYDASGDLKCAVAEDYTISEDGLTYTFKLRKGVKFHDGSEVTADDVIYSINRYAENSQLSSFYNMAGVTKDDDETVTIRLAEPDTDFLAVLTLAIIPESNEDPDRKVIGTGPYKFVSRVPQESVTLEAFEDYWGEKAKIANITLKVIANPDAIVMELKGGAVDLYCRVTDTQAAELMQDDDFEILEGTMNLVQALYLNNNVAPFDDVRVRQALCYAIDPQEIMDFVSGGKGTEIGSSMFPAFGKYFDENLNHVYDQNLDKAKELLAEAGYADGFSFKITVPSNYQQHVATAEVLVEEFAKIGVDAKIELVEWNTWLQDVYTDRHYESTVIGVDASTLTAGALLQRFVSDNDKNFINFHDPAYDTAYLAAVSTTDEAEQTADYKECLEILANEAANVYIQDLPTFVAVRKNIGGYQFYPLYVQDFASLYITEE